jgi:predicted nuclease of predicted toxin-antitoxin system
LLFLLDVHLPTEASAQLRQQGIDAVHAIELGLERATDHDLLAQAAGRERILVTRNVRDFAPLAKAHARTGRHFPGILFPSPSIPQEDVGGLVRAIADWVRALPRGENPIADTYGWLRSGAKEDEGSPSF